jgi:hypothetical protein
MTTQSVQGRNVVVMNAEWWDSIQVDIADCVCLLNEVTSVIAAFDHGKPITSGQVIDRADGTIRAVRCILENILTPI